MIKAQILRNKDKDVCGFVVKNHGASIVCSAVSLLAQNTINSIESLTSADMDVDYKKKGGYISFSLIDTENLNKDALLLLNSFVLGLKSTAKKYPKHLLVIDSGGATDVRN